VFSMAKTLAAKSLSRVRLKTVEGRPSSLYNPERVCNLHTLGYQPPTAQIVVVDFPTRLTTLLDAY
jgi:hypothetical protein